MTSGRDSGQKVCRLYELIIMARLGVYIIVLSLNATKLPCVMVRNLREGWMHVHFDKCSI